MRKILTIGMLSIIANAYAQKQNQFITGSANSSTLTVSLSSQTTHIYKKIGIKMTGGYTLSNPSADCTSIVDDFCIFTLGYQTPKSFSISGTGSAAEFVTCLNAPYPSVSCQYNSFPVSNVSTYTDYLYVVEDTDVQLCLVDTNGVISNCNSAFATPVTLERAQSIVFDTNNQYAYISSKKDGSGTNNGYITACEINQTSKQLTNCNSLNLSSTILPQQLAYLSDSANMIDYIYMTSIEGSSSYVYRCTVSATNVTSCQQQSLVDGNSSPLFSANFTGIAINQINSTNYAYVVNNPGAKLFNCTINITNNTFTCPSAVPSGTINPVYVSFTPSKSGIYLPYYSGIVNYFPIVSDLVSTPSTLAGSSFSQPVQAITSSSGNYAFVSNNLANKISTCTINQSSNAFSSPCTTNTQTFTSPRGLAVLPY